MLVRRTSNIFMIYGKNEYFFFFSLSFFYWFFWDSAHACSATHSLHLNNDKRFLRAVNGVWSVSLRHGWQIPVKWGTWNSRTLKRANSLGAETRLSESAFSSSIAKWLHLRWIRKGSWIWAYVKAEPSSPLCVRPSLIRLSPWCPTRYPCKYRFLFVLFCFAF